MTEELSGLTREKAFLRLVATQSIVGRPMAISCQALWQQLIEGEAIVVDEFFCQDRSHLAFTRRPRAERSLRLKRDLDILARALGGIDQKVIALELGLANSTITTALRRSLEFIGLTCAPSRVPLLLGLMVHAAKHASAVPDSRIEEHEFEGKIYHLLSAPVPEWSFAPALSPAVRAVVRMRAEGRSHAEIAKHRRTSRRTVANQLAAAFQRLGVSGRSNLIELLSRP